MRFLSYLAENSLSVDEGSWKLGIAILSVCQNILVCHGTRDLYVGKGLLFDSNGFSNILVTWVTQFPLFIEGVTGH